VIQEPLRQVIGFVLKSQLTVALMGPMHQVEQASWFLA
jgi:hypothetical protein